MAIEPNDVRRILKTVLAANDDAQAAVLDALCEGNDELRAQVRTMLEEQAPSAAGNDATADFVAHTSSLSGGNAVTADANDDSPVSPPTTIVQQTDAYPTVIAGRYTLEKKIGEGGMGEVWVARQSEPVKRRVALKLIKTGMDSKAALARFEQERQALALMEHPNIAKVLDAGTTPAGSPFFVMELVKGLPLIEYCDSVRLSPEQRLELFVSVCRAVQHAHQKGIVHRDLKPANILVEVVDGKPAPKVIDFGVAKAMQGKLTEASLSTGLGAVVGTLEYMAPEQAGTTGEDVDTRADVYALGVVLYELMTGLRPFDSKQLRKGALAELIRIIQEDDPAKPSTRLSSAESLPSAAALRQTDPRKLMSELRGELDWVIMKCLEKSRDRRYETVSGLAEDLRRYLSRQPVVARPPSASYRMQKFFLRNRGYVVAAGLFLVALLAGIVGTTLGLIEANRQTDLALTSARAAETARKSEASQRILAERANRQAFDALEAFTSSLVGDLLGSKSELTETERSILENAQKQWEVFAQSHGNSIEARMIRAKGAANLSTIQYHLGFNLEAEANDRKALGIWESLAGASPTDEACRFELAIAHQKLGGSLRGSGKRAESRTHFRKAADAFESLVIRFSGNSEYQIRLSESRISVGNVERDFGNWSAASQQYLQAQSIQESLVAQWPDSVEYQESLARSHWGSAFLAKRQDKTAESKGHYQRAIAIYEQLSKEPPATLSYRQSVANLRREFGVMLSDARDDNAGAQQLAQVLPIQEAIVEQFPAIPLYKYDLSRSCRDYCQILGYLGRREDASKQLNTSIALLLELIEEHPTVLQYQAGLGIAYRMLGDLVGDGEQPAEALSHYQDAILILTAAHVQDRNVTLLRNALCNSYEHRALTLDGLTRHNDALRDWEKVLELCTDASRNIHLFQQVDSRIRSGNFENAIADLEQLAKIENPNPNHWFRFAKLYALASQHFADRQNEFSDRTMELLQKAVELEFSDSERIRTDVDLRPFLNRDDMKQLLQHIEP